MDKNVFGTFWKEFGKEEKKFEPMSKQLDGLWQVNMSKSP